MPLAQGDKALQCRVYAPVGSPRAWRGPFISPSTVGTQGARTRLRGRLLCFFPSYGKDWRVFLAVGNTELLKEFSSAAPLVKKGPRSKGRNNNAQIDGCCCRWFSLLDVGTGTNTRAASSARRNDHASSLRMRPGEDPGRWALRGPNHNPSYPPSHPQELLLRDMRA